MIRLFRNASDSGGNNPNGSNGNQDPGLGGSQGDGFVEREWMKDLGADDLRKSKSLSKFETKDALAKSYLEAEAEIGKRVRIPGPEASAEDWGKFFSRIGRPDSPEGYEIPQGKLDKSLEAQIRKDALAAGLSKAQAKLMAEGLASYSDQVRAAHVLAREQAEIQRKAVLEATFKSNLPIVMAKAEKAFTALFSPSLQQKLASSDLRNDADFVGALAMIADNMGEDKLVTGSFRSEEHQKDPYDWMIEKYQPKG